MCFSCGFDVPGWHTSQTCPVPCRKEHHHEGCNRTNYLQYQAQGYRVNMRRANKTFLPSNLNIINSMSVLYEPILNSYFNVSYNQDGSNKCTIVTSNVDHSERESNLVSDEETATV